MAEATLLQQLSGAEDSKPSAPLPFPRPNINTADNMFQRKYNLGSGINPIDTYDNSIDLKHGEAAYPLKLRDNSAGILRASHLLEHFRKDQIADVLKDWVRVLEPGGELRISVPDFRKLAECYLMGKEIPLQGFVHGGQSDEHDVHYVSFDHDSLEAAMRQAGLVAIRRWVGDKVDSSGFPISLNLAGFKPLPMPKIGAVMSVPRLGFMDNFQAVIDAIGRLRFPIKKVTGAYWGQCLTRGIEQTIEEGHEWVLTIDYDTVFSAQTIIDLVAIAQHIPKCDAIAPLQVGRGKGQLLNIFANADGTGVATAVNREDFEVKNVLPSVSAHFGCTLLRAQAFSKLKRPWFKGEEDEDGRWGEGRKDDDIVFWKRWQEAGNSLYSSLRTVVGHGEFFITWPDQNLELMVQNCSEYWNEGPPRQLWR